MALPALFRSLFARDGKGPHLRPDIIPVDGVTITENEDGKLAASGSGLSLLDFKWSATGLAEPGFIDLSQDHGPLSRSVYPAAWAKLAQALEADTGAVVDKATWLAELEANNGVCGRFSTGDGESTFRVPLLRKRASFGFPDPEAGAGQGDFLEDRMRPITGEFTQRPSAGSLAAAFGRGRGGCIIQGTPTGTALLIGYESGSGATYEFKIDSANLGQHYSGDITHGPLIVWTPLMKLYGTKADDSEKEIASLYETVEKKLDTAKYEADIAARTPYTAKALLDCDSNGAIINCHNITSVSSNGSGAYCVYSPAVSPICLPIVTAYNDGINASAQNIYDKGYVRVSTYNTFSPGYTLSRFTLVIF